jgi:hypothetical protein
VPHVRLPGPGLPWERTWAENEGLRPTIAFAESPRRIQAFLGPHQRHRGQVLMAAFARTQKIVNPRPGMIAEVIGLP